MLLNFGWNLSVGMLMTLLWKCLMYLVFGRNGCRRRISLLLVGLRQLVLVSMCLLLRWPFDGAVWGVAEECGVALPCFYACSWYPADCSMCRVLGRHTGLAIWALITLMLPGLLVGLLDRDCLAEPLPLVKDGELVALAQHMIRARGRETFRVTNVEGHATDADVEQGCVRLEDQLGNAEAHTAADLGRRHKSELLIDATRVLLKVRDHWYPIMLQLHRFMIAVARVTVNHDGRGGTAPLVWDQRGQRKMRRTDIRVTVDLASLPGPTGFLNGPWKQVHGGRIADADIAAWPYSVGSLCKFTAFLGTLHWPVGVEDMGHFGVSYLELLILFEQWAGHRLLNEKVIRPHLRAHRPNYFSSVPVSEGN